MAMRPLHTRTETSLLVRTLTVALTPVIYAAKVANRLFAWGYGQFSAVMQLPIKALVVCLQVADGLICDVLAYLTKQPALRSQVRSYQQTISALQLANKAQQKQILLLQSDLDGVKLEKSKIQIRNLELSDKVQALQQRLSKQAAAAEAAKQLAAGGPFAAADAASQQKQQLADGPADSTEYGSSRQAGSVTYGAKSWYLHACVLLAAIGVRWWLMNQTDPLQRKIMLVIIWPIAWVYGAMLFNCMPQSSTLRAAMACCCWALMGYIAHEMVSFSVSQHQQRLAA